MARLSSCAVAVGALVFAFQLGCGTHVPKPLPPAAPLLHATLQQLVDSFNRNANAVQTMTLKLELTARAGNKRYPRINAYLLTQKPDDIRIWGTFTLLGRLFDMASNGTQFELSLPTRNQFIEGENQYVPITAPSPLEKLRPQVIRDALLINPILPDQKIAFDPGENPTEYDVLVLVPQPGSVERLLRRITFSRYDLLPHRQILYDVDPAFATHATYSHFTIRDGIPVPQDMTMERPREGYSLRLQVVRGGITLNRPFPDPNTFQLQPPTGSNILKLGPPAH